MGSVDHKKTKKAAGTGVEIPHGKVVSQITQSVENSGLSVDIHNGWIVYRVCSGPSLAKSSIAGVQFGEACEKASEYRADHCRRSGLDRLRIHGP